MAEDVVIQGGLFDLLIRNALSEADDAITGDKANIMNMALARGCWFQWEYTVQMGLHTGEIEEDLALLQEMRNLYAEVAGWTSLMLENPAALSEQLNQLFQWGAGSGLTNQASSVVVPGLAPGVIGPIPWPALTENSAVVPTKAIGLFEDLQVTEFRTSQTFAGTLLYQSADGIYFRVAAINPPPTSGPQHEFVRIERDQITLVFDDDLLGGELEIGKARRELEAAIESKTQRSQEQQAQLQDISAGLQRWFNFTTNLNERKKRDADTIAGNFH